MATTPRELDPTPYGFETLEQAVQRVRRHTQVRNMQVHEWIEHKRKTAEAAKRFEERLRRQNDSIAAMCSAMREALEPKPSVVARFMRWITR